MGKTILTVDDSATVRQTVAMTLARAGYDIVQASNGVEAVGLLGRSFDLVITDLNMPKMNGIELIGEIRKSGGNRFVPILVLTTESQPEMKQKAKAAGATGWLVKPFRPDQLVSVVGRVVE